MSTDLLNRALPPSSCRVESAVAILAGKWKPMVLHHLQGGPKRFGTLSAALPEVSARMLTRTLREMERDGLVVRLTDRSGYALTESAGRLVPLLNSLADWGATHWPEAADRS